MRDRFCADEKDCKRIFVVLEISAWQSLFSERIQCHGRRSEPQGCAVAFFKICGLSMFLLGADRGALFVDTLCDLAEFTSS